MRVKRAGLEPATPGGTALERPAIFPNIPRSVLHPGNAGDRSQSLLRTGLRTPSAGRPSDRLLLAANVLDFVELGLLAPQLLARHGNEQRLLGERDRVVERVLHEGAHRRLSQSFLLRVNEERS
jgi:hypothetical protein